MGTMSLGSGWATCPGHELARHLLVVSSLDDGKLSPGGLEAPGCCAIAAQEGCQQISGIKRAPCEVLGAKSLCLEGLLALSLVMPYRTQKP